MTTPPLTLADALEANLRLWEAVCQGRSIPKGAKSAVFHVVDNNRLSIHAAMRLQQMPRLPEFDPKCSDCHLPLASPAKT